MSHTVTSKLNNDARQHQNANGMTFFVSLGEKNYNFKTKENEYTNYDAAIFAKDGQIAFYQSALIKGSIVTVTGSGVMIDIDPSGQYKPKLVLQDAKIEFVHSDQNQPMQQPQQQHNQPMAQPQGGFSQPHPQNPQNAAYTHPQAHTQQGGFQQQPAPQPQNQFDQNSGTPF
jgi:single-strand DNA-binding protein